MSGRLLQGISDIAGVGDVGVGRLWVEFAFCLRASSSSLKSLGVGEKSRSDGAASALGGSPSAPALVASCRVVSYMRKMLNRNESSRSARREINISSHPKGVKSKQCASLPELRPPRDPHPPAVHHKWPTLAVIFQPHPPARRRRDSPGPISRPRGHCPFT